MLLERDLSIARLFIRIDVPDNIVGQSKDAVSRALGHLGETFRLGLVLECVCGEVDAGAVDICFDDDVDAADAVKGNFFVWIGVPVAHFGHVDTVGLVFFVAWTVLV